MKWTILAQDRDTLQALVIRKLTFMLHTIFDKFIIYPKSEKLDRHW
jgi:hypothetical protein